MWRGLEKEGNNMKIATKEVTVKSSRNMTEIKEEVKKIKEKNYRLLRKNSRKCYCKGGKTPCAICDYYGYCCRDKAYLKYRPNNDLSGCCEECRDMETE